MSPSLRKCVQVILIFSTICTNKLFISHTKKEGQKMLNYACTAFSFNSQIQNNSLLGQKDQQALSVNATSH